MHVRVLPLAAVLALTAATSWAGEREWRDLRKTFDAALAAVEGDRGRDPEATKKARADLRAAADGLLGESEQRTVELLLPHLSHRLRSVSEVARDVLQRVRDPRATKALVKAYEDADGAARELLSQALRQNPSADVTAAFVKALRHRDANVRASAAAARGGRGAEARAAAEPLLQRALKDDAVVVRWAAARSLETLTGTRPEGFPEPQLLASGLLERYPYDRVAFLFDTSTAAGERAFGDVLAADAAAQAPPDKAADDANPGRRRGGKAEPAPAPAEPPPPVSPHDIAVKAVTEVLKTFGETPTVHLVRFAGQGAVRAYQDGFARLQGDEARTKALEWLGRAPTDRGRDVLDAVRRALEQSPPPQLIHVFLCGGPEGRGAASTEELKERLADLLWGRDITIHVTAFTIPPAQEPTDERGRQARAEAEGAYGAYVEAIAQVGRGRATRLSLTRPSREPEEAPVTTEEKKFPVDLTKPITTRDVGTIRTALREAVEKADARAETFVEDVAACPDKKVLPLALETLRSGGHGVQQAVVRGLAKNADPALGDALAKALQDERDPALKLLLLRACGRSTQPVGTTALVDALDGLSPDGLRVAWSLLAQRPAAELAAQQARLARAARGLAGLADFFARTALALASGQPAPATSGLDVQDGAFLPGRFVASGVAFVVDTHRDMDAVFYAPPAPPAQQGQGDEPSGRRRGRDEPKKEDPPPPVSRLGAAQRELERALGAAAQNGAKANVLTTGGRSWQGQAATLDDRQRDAAVKFVQGLTTTAQRDVWKALKQAIEDASVEVVYLLVCGPPLRSPGSSDPAELLRSVRQLNRERAVTIHVVYVLGPSGPAGSAEAAARVDLLTGLDAVYRTLAEETGGRVTVREALAGLATPAPATPPARR